MKSIIHYWKLSLTIIIGIIALALFFRLHQPILAQWLVSIYAIFIAIILLIDMI